MVSRYLRGVGLRPKPNPDPGGQPVLYHNATTETQKLIVKIQMCSTKVGIFPTGARFLSLEGRVKSTELMYELELCIFLTLR